MRDLVRRVEAKRRFREGEQRRLLELATLGEKASQERLVATNLGLVIRLAAEREQQGVSTPDLVQEGSIGLVEAIRSFAGSGENDFASFAEWQIGAQMDEAIATEAAAVRDAELLVTASTDYEPAALVLRPDLNRHPTVTDVAAQL